MNEENEDADDSKSCTGDDNYGFTREQYDQLVHFLHALILTHNSSTRKMNHVSHNNNHTTSGITRISYTFNHSNLGSWIVDSGASYHICSSMRFFDDYKRISSVNIRLPNGKMVVAKHAGTVKLSSKLIAHNFLFVLDFNLNLLSVSRMCLNLDYIIIFDNEKCLIQENRSLRMISMIDLIEGLYFLVTQDTPQATITSSHSQAPHDITSIP